jgi:hypothetical protein
LINVAGEIASGMSFRYLGRVIRAHIFAHDILGGKVCPLGYHRDHTCHFSMCVNPDHLEAVTHKVNEERKQARARTWREALYADGKTPDKASIDTAAAEFRANSLHKVLT